MYQARTSLSRISLLKPDSEGPRAQEVRREPGPGQSRSGAAQGNMISDPTMSSVTNARERGTLEPDCTEVTMETAPATGPMQHVSMETGTSSLAMVQPYLFGNQDVGLFPSLTLSHSHSLPLSLSLPLPSLSLSPFPSPSPSLTIAAHLAALWQTQGKSTDL